MPLSREAGCVAIVLKISLTAGGASVASLEAEPKAAQRSRPLFRLPHRTESIKIRGLKYARIYKVYGNRKQRDAPA